VARRKGHGAFFKPTVVVERSSSERKARPMAKKKAKPITRVAIVLDRFGSMLGNAPATVDHFNEQVERFANAKDQEVRISLVTFNEEVTEHMWDEPVKNLEKITPADYRPCGGTALRDAWGHTLKKLRKTEDPKEANGDLAYYVIVITDGIENSSSHITWEALEELNTSCEAEPNWTISLIGCNKRDIESMASRFGMDVTNCAAWAPDTAEGAAHAYAATAAVTDDFLMARSAGVTKMKCLHSKVVGAAADYGADIPQKDVDADVDSVDTVDTSNRVIGSSISTGNSGPALGTPADFARRRGVTANAAWQNSDDPETPSRFAGKAVQWDEEEDS